MPVQSAARKAWNEAMKATAGGAALPPALQQRPTKRRSDRNKKQERRAKARKVHQSMMDGGDSDDYRSAVWVDALEGIDPSRFVPGDEDDDDEYDELDEIEGGGGGGNKGNTATTTNKRKRGGRGGGGGVGGKQQKSTKKKAGVLPKRFLPRSMAAILIEEASREDGTARAFLKAEARLVPSSSNNKQQLLPPAVRKYCPVTGVVANYTEPKSNIPYSNFRALEQIRERPPPWMTLSGSAAYWEAVKSIRGEEE